MLPDPSTHLPVPGLSVLRRALERSARITGRYLLRCICTLLGGHFAVSAELVSPLLGVSQLFFWPRVLREGAWVFPGVFCPFFLVFEVFHLLLLMQVGSEVSRDECHVSVLDQLDQLIEGRDRFSCLLRATGCSLLPSRLLLPVIFHHLLTSRSIDRAINRSVHNHPVE